MLTLFSTSSIHNCDATLTSHDARLHQFDWIGHPPPTSARGSIVSKRMTSCATTTFYVRKGRGWKKCSKFCTPWVSQIGQLKSWTPGIPWATTCSLRKHDCVCDNSQQRKLQCLESSCCFVSALLKSLLASRAAAFAKTCVVQSNLALCSAAVRMQFESPEIKTQDLKNFCFLVAE